VRPFELETFSDAIDQLTHRMNYRSSIVHPDKWQGIEIKNKPEMATHELTHVSFAVPIKSENLADHVQDIKPNIPWADDHFRERVGMQPINPGIEWKNWPHGDSAERFLDKNGKFNHNYMERYWPKRAGHVKEPC
jgi:hypothetical protein